MCQVPISLPGINRSAIHKHPLWGVAKSDRQNPAVTRCNFFPLSDREALHPDRSRKNYRRNSPTSSSKLAGTEYDTVFGFFADSIPLAADEGTTLKIDLDLERWSVADAAELYEVARWGKGYFSVERRRPRVSSIRRKIPQRSIDLKQLVDRLQLRGIDLPILIRFADILKHRLGEIHNAFQTAMPSTNTRAVTAACIRSR